MDNILEAAHGILEVVDGELGRGNGNGRDDMPGPSDDPANRPRQEEERRVMYFNAAPYNPKRLQKVIEMNGKEERIKRKREEEDNEEKRNDDHRKSLHNKILKVSGHVPEEPLKEHFPVIIDDNSVLDLTTYPLLGNQKALSVLKKLEPILQMDPENQKHAVTFLANHNMNECSYQIVSSFLKFLDQELAKQGKYTAAPIAPQPEEPRPLRGILRKPCRVHRRPEDHPRALDSDGNARLIFQRRPEPRVANGLRRYNMIHQLAPHPHLEPRPVEAVRQVVEPDPLARVHEVMPRYHRNPIFEPYDEIDRLYNRQDALADFRRRRLRPEEELRHRPQRRDIVVPPPPDGQPQLPGAPRNGRDAPSRSPSPAPVPPFVPPVQVRPQQNDMMRRVAPRQALPPPVADEAPQDGRIVRQRARLENGDIVETGIGPNGVGYVRMHPAQQRQQEDFVERIRAIIGPDREVPAANLVPTGVGPRNQRPPRQHQLPGAPREDRNAPARTPSPAPVPPVVPPAQDRPRQNDMVRRAAPPEAPPPPAPQGYGAPQAGLIVQQRAGMANGDELDERFLRLHIPQQRNDEDRNRRRRRDLIREYFRTPSPPPVAQPPPHDAQPQLPGTPQDGRNAPARAPSPAPVRPVVPPAQDRPRRDDMLRRVAPRQTPPQLVADGAPQDGRIGRQRARLEIGDLIDPDERFLRLFTPERHDRENRNRRRLLNLMSPLRVDLSPSPPPDAQPPLPNAQPRLPGAPQEDRNVPERVPIPAPVPPVVPPAQNLPRRDGMLRRVAPRQTPPQLVADGAPRAERIGRQRARLENGDIIETGVGPNGEGYVRMHPAQRRQQDDNQLHGAPQDGRDAPARYPSPPLRNGRQRNGMVLRAVPPQAPPPPAPHVDGIDPDERFLRLFTPEDQEDRNRRRRLNMMGAYMVDLSPSPPPDARQPPPDAQRQLPGAPQEDRNAPARAPSPAPVPPVVPPPQNDRRQNDTMRRQDGRIVRQDGRIVRQRARLDNGDIIETGIGPNGKGYVRMHPVHQNAAARAPGPARPAPPEAPQLHQNAAARVPSPELLVPAVAPHLQITLPDGQTHNYNDWTVIDFTRWMRRILGYSRASTNAARTIAAHYRQGSSVFMDFINGAARLQQLIDRDLSVGMYFQIEREVKKVYDSYRRAQQAQ